MIARVATPRWGYDRLGCNPALEQRMVHLMGAKNGAFDLSEIVHAMHYNESYVVALVSRID